MITFHILGDPVPQGRPRFFRRGSFVGTYKQDKDTQYRTLVQLQVKSQAVKNGVRLPLSKTEAGFEVHISVGIKPPASWSNSAKQKAITGEIKPLSRPDLDNYIKAIFDAFNGLVWKDDSEVVSIIANKHYRPDPGVCVCIK